MRLRSALAALMCCASFATIASAEGFLRAEGKQIVDGAGRAVILRGMGLGGWMLQEGYMLQMGEVGRGQQHVIRGKIAELIGEEKTARFYEAWLDNHTTKADIDYMAAQGFNSVRLPMHYDLLTLPADQEPKSGADTWHEDGFKRIDDLLAWSKANGLYLILDLHAAPGGQGNDLPIADRDPSKPSLWDSPENRRKTVAIWRKLAERYKDEPGIGAYDIINEPNWDFEGDGGGHGCKEEKNAPLRSLMMEITAAIREVDKRHMVIIEGNCWGNNYKGVMPPWDDNLAVSFHKYWNVNDRASIEPLLKLRDEHKVPLWLGESGENSNVWFRDSIALVEGEGIGWAYWPLKKIGFNQPLEIRSNPDYAKVVAYLTSKGPKPTAAEAERGLMKLADDLKFENNIAHPDVIDAMIRLPHADETRPFKAHTIGRTGGTIQAVDYDLGPIGQAYFDIDAANYHVSTGKERTLWNNGRAYRNDGVDVAVAADGAPYVSDFKPDEWMRYTLQADAAGTYDVELKVMTKAAGGVAVSVNQGTASVAAVPAGGAWRTVNAQAVRLQKGSNALVLRSVDCDCAIASVRLTPARR
ncbi:cellulase family glycosylhydrolase [Caulobacter segnis]|uniref:cellulase family glycosylhydrolase n=1 Tax=Caulobacter segnis TaxID=88688 RepID=UPI00240EC3FC|nr:cellulase family glycosylhydrolase [Caulobacter segnis]MDG2521106.1 cellulase family glycosylhydrolase [Caulobacter segnis]